MFDMTILLYNVKLYITIANSKKKKIRHEKERQKLKTVDFRLPPLCPVPLGFSFNLKRIGRRGWGVQAEVGGVVYSLKEPGGWEERKLALLCCCSEITWNWDPLPARVWFIS
jgi:hypothetical protein